ncbi:spore coat protein CotJB [Anaerovorax odorimutans]|uniref:Spore coat protein CotJB n=1 Tax=Anaerovorax odorimutans TaxID=109327 RepID=A0ABT1RR62_9FIRM|nr:spore coat protein CotJB [Anaerovorax odorimutans]MCQ4637651.1 spore coat protein CotJB [Anaerovorax odorimutans]
MSRRTEMLKKVQQLNFVMIDVGLYLNNQPDSPAALALFNKYQALHAQAKKEYEEAYGPLTYNGIDAEKDGWSWINKPWPWEVED